MLDSLGAAAEMKDDPSKGNAEAARVIKLCTGPAYADVRAMAAEYRNAKSLEVRADLAARLYEQLDSITAGWQQSATDAPVTAMGA